MTYALPRPAATVRTARLHLVNRAAVFGWPWGILASSFATNYLIVAVVNTFTDARLSLETGGLGALYVMAFVTYTSAMTQWFAFAVGLSVSRARYYLATALAAAAQAALSGAALVVLLALERATGGWGVDLAFFGVPLLVVDHPLVQLAVYAVPLLTLSSMGMVTGVVYQRWGQPGILVGSLALTFVAAVLSTVITWRRAWPAVGDWLTTQSPVALLAGWPLVPTLALLAGGFALVRRASP